LLFLCLFVLINMADPAPAKTTMELDPVERNPGIPLDMGWVESVRVNMSAVQRRALTHRPRRGVKKEWQMAWMARVISCIDLTTLKGDDTPHCVRRLCHKAKTPIRQDIEARMKIPHVTTGAVCVYSRRVADAVKALGDSGVPVAAVATGFPAGQTPLVTRLAEIRFAVEQGAKEIDIVISREQAILGKWEEMYDEVKQMREACGDAHMKTILSTGELPSLRHVKKASLVCMMAGADFIKTSTGMEAQNATLEVGFVMVRAIRDYHEATGHRVGFKPAGGVSSSKDAMGWLTLMFEELGERWCHPDLFRIGASRLLTDLERQLWYTAVGEYADMRYMPMS
jgi:deoxyribose-phosphate aldolase